MSSQRLLCLKYLTSGVNTVKSTVKTFAKQLQFNHFHSSTVTVLFTRSFVILNKNMNPILDVIQRSLLWEICWRWSDVCESASKYCVYHTLIPMYMTAFPCQSDFVCYFQTWRRHEYIVKRKCDIISFQCCFCIQRDTDLRQTLKVM